MIAEPVFAVITDRGISVVGIRPAARPAFVMNPVIRNRHTVGVPEFEAALIAVALHPVNAENR